MASVGNSRCAAAAAAGPGIPERPAAAAAGTHNLDRDKNCLKMQTQNDYEVGYLDRDKNCLKMQTQNDDDLIEPANLKGVRDC